MLREPVECWCGLDLVPDAGASTVSLQVASIDGRPAPGVEAVRDVWIATSQPTRLGLTRQSARTRSGGLGEAVADRVAETRGRRHHGDHAPAVAASSASRRAAHRGAGVAGQVVGHVDDDRTRGARTAAPVPRRGVVDQHDAALGA